MTPGIRKALTIFIFFFLGSMLIFLTVLDIIFTFRNVGNYVSNIDYLNVPNGIYQKNIFLMFAYGFSENTEKASSDYCWCLKLKYLDPNFFEFCELYEDPEPLETTKVVGDMTLIEFR